MPIRIYLIVCLALAACGKKDTKLTDGDCTLKQDSEACADHIECCSGVCTNGKCLSNANCDGFGVACSSGATCCSGQCTDDGTGSFHCGSGLGRLRATRRGLHDGSRLLLARVLGGVCVDQLCTSIGGGCSADSDCCGNDCDATCKGGRGV